MSLSRLNAFNNTATTTVVLAAANRLTQKPMIQMKDDHHHNDHHMSLPNSIKPSTTESLSKLLIRGNLKVSNPFTSKIKFWFIIFSILYFSFLKGSVSTRFAHTDIKIPNFNDYRNDYSENAAQSSKENSDDKQTYSYISTFGKIFKFKFKIVDSIVNHIFLKALV